MHSFLLLLGILLYDYTIVCLISCHLCGFHFLLLQRWLSILAHFSGCANVGVPREYVWGGLVGNKILNLWLQEVLPNCLPKDSYQFTAHQQCSGMPYVRHHHKHSILCWMTFLAPEQHTRISGCASRVSRVSDPCASRQLS